MNNMFANVSTADLEKERNKSNPNAYAVGDGGTSFDGGNSDTSVSFDDLSSLFDQSTDGDEPDFMNSLYGGNSAPTYNGGEGGFDSSYIGDMQSGVVGAGSYPALDATGSGAGGWFGTGDSAGGSQVLATPGVGNSFQSSNTSPKSRGETFVDAALDFSAEGAKGVFNLILLIIKTIPTRTVDDMALYFGNVFTISGITAVIGVAFTLLGLFTKASFIGVSHIGGDLLLSGILSCGIGAIGFGASTFMKAAAYQESNEYQPEYTAAEVNSIAHQHAVEVSTNKASYDNPLGFNDGTEIPEPKVVDGGDTWEAIFGTGSGGGDAGGDSGTDGTGGDTPYWGNTPDGSGDDGDGDGGLEGVFGNDSDPDDEYLTPRERRRRERENYGSDEKQSVDALLGLPDNTQNNTTDKNPEETFLSNVEDNAIITRKKLVDTFKAVLPLSGVDFSKETDIDPDDELYSMIQITCLKGMSYVLGCDYEEVKSRATSIKETFIAYKVRMSRIKSLGQNKISALATEIATQLKTEKDSEAPGVTVDIMGDNYLVVIPKGDLPVITIGDALQRPELYDFFCNTKNKLPMVMGINELGMALTDDMKSFDSMLIAGKARSGKSWYILSALLSMMLFNDPNDVQFIIIDPKVSNMFTQLALMPHVAGLHDDKDVLTILDDLIENEAPRRKKLLKDHTVENIWDLRDKGIKLPVLYLVIDEFMTVTTTLGDDLSKEFNAKLKTILTQFPSIGIRIFIVPHRTTGVVDKTLRMLFSYSAIARGEPSEVLDTLNIKKFDKPLLKPGDIGLKTNNMKEAAYVRGLALSDSDTRNNDLILTFAKAFYKMGVEIPDMSTLEFAANRDENRVRKTLYKNNIIQYDETSAENEEW